MNRAWIILLVLLPAFAEAVGCQNVAPDGTLSFHQVDGDKCDSGLAMPEYSRAYRSDPPVTAASVQAKPDVVEAYESVRVTDPADKAVVHRNDGNFEVTDLDMFLTDFDVGRDGLKVVEVGVEGLGERLVLAQR